MEEEQEVFYIPYIILEINEQITKNAEDAVLKECYSLAFDWANRMGRQGKVVYDLVLKMPDYNNYNPLNQKSYLMCKIGCTKEERYNWEEIQKHNIKHTIYTALDEE